MSINNFTLQEGELSMVAISVFEKVAPSLEHKEATVSNSKLMVDSLDEVVGTC